MSRQPLAGRHVAVLLGGLSAERGGEGLQFPAPPAPMRWSDWGQGSGHAWMPGATWPRC